MSIPDKLLRIKEVLNLIPVSRSTWYIGVKSGRFPRPIKLGVRIAVWPEKDIFELISNRGIKKIKPTQEKK